MADFDIDPAILARAKNAKATLTPEHLNDVLNRTIEQFRLQGLTIEIADPDLVCPGLLWWHRFNVRFEEQWLNQFTNAVFAGCVDAGYRTPVALSHQSVYTG